MSHKIRVTTLLLLTLMLTSGAALQAQTVIELFGPGERPSSPVIEARLSQTSGLVGVTQGVATPTSFYILPRFVVDVGNGNGVSTLFAVRNEAAVDNEVDIELFTDASLSPFDSFSVTLEPKEIATYNLRDVLPSSPPGLSTGWARIIADEPMTADFFQVTPGQAFAAGGIPVDISNGGFCETVKARFLIGGGFSGGTTFTLMQDAPQGPDEPSVEGTVFSEAGDEINTFNIRTESYSFTANAEDLVLGANFGSIDFRFVNASEGFSGGAVFVNHSALGQFTVGLEGHCLDTE